MPAFSSQAPRGIVELVFVIPTSTNFHATVTGYGFLALAVLIFTVVAQLAHSRGVFFGAMKMISSAYSGIPIIKDLPIPSDVYKMIPFIATLVLLTFLSKRSQAPRASGIPFEKGER